MVWYHPQVKKQDVWLDECEFDISKWEGRYRHEQGEHEKTERKYKEALEKADKERVVLRKEAQRLSLELERVLEGKEKLEATMKELEATAAVERKKPESRTTSSSTSMSMKSLVSYEQRIVALKMETVKLKQEAEAVEGSGG
ncbi:hypothetical protein Pmar_PMAR020188 [Perkinsus marinus ATCC 50983]|uniref:Uncharacterized protein n=1 Tax=Perkinsus marinus (strain ATCC 50983 / TXsc) TaxID=423536 RepID=C5KA36_PERM5|nr:hypothetical protein Pmar_PMAR020188 [Perkinsus marinus ATCC 50983]EER18657.1 hypothetical protein Pmar_PMAR020188 [Perkinsus marinus ATCC 50983]|eukprot:XP_002786861.1 hypothetical protein Pmar_PMAR020188 [Perkinsus marinus ATCC 50983]